jgi:hypothetical protein
MSSSGHGSQILCSAIISSNNRIEAVPVEMNQNSIHEVAGCFDPWLPKSGLNDVFSTANDLSSGVLSTDISQYYGKNY